jgi:NAD(P)-dependent dehydrogenase (short-subunit alcohol dehydrogenase family)
MYIITGASKNIGRYLFTRLKQSGEKVIGFYNSTIEGFEEDSSSYYKLDITDYDAVEKWVESVHPELHQIKLINCAGISYSGFAHKADIEEWQRVIQVNLFGAFNIIRALLPLMREQNYGRIINFSSVVTKMPTPGVSAYAASKSALIGLTKTLSIENVSLGITVNSINLGYTNAGMGVNDVPEKYREIIIDKIPEKRFCEPIEIFNTIEYIIKTEYLSGSIIDLNGGLI